MQPSSSTPEPLPRQTAESTEAQLRKEIRRLQGLVDRRAKLDAEILKVLSKPTPPNCFPNTGAEILANKVIKLIKQAK